MMVGLQGSGKTTTTAKIAKRLTERDNRKVLMASLDTRRPAAMEQLAVLGQQVDVADAADRRGPDAGADREPRDPGRPGSAATTWCCSTPPAASRSTKTMMNEAAEVKRAANPHEVLLVADALTGQDAVNLARSFDERVGLTGIVLTRVDGDGRGGAALSMRAVTGKPIKLIGTGERMDALEDFDPAPHRRPHPRHGRHRLAGREGRGHDRRASRRCAPPSGCARASSTSSDLREQLAGMQKMGGMSGLMGMMPGVAKIKSQIAERNLDDSVLKRQMAIIDSMTPGERKHPDILKASRKKRIAAGSGTKVEEVNKLLKMHRGMADMMKAMGGGKARGPMAGLAQMMGMGGGMPSPEEMAKLAEKMPGGMPPDMPGAAAGDAAGDARPAGPWKFPGLGGGRGKLPTPGGLPPDFCKKK